MRKLLVALTGALILTGPHALAKNSCVEILSSGAPLTAPPRDEHARERRVSQLLASFFRSEILSANHTGRIELIPDGDKVSVASEEFDELSLAPFARALGGQNELIRLLTTQAPTKVKRALFMVIHEGRLAETQFYNPRALPEQAFGKSEFSGEVRAIALNSPEGQALLNEARAANLSDEVIVAHYQPQSFTTFCGIASSCMVISSLRTIPLRQDTFMRWNRHVKPEAVVKAQIGEDPGFQLEQLVRVLNSRKDRATGFYADEHDAQALEQEILRTIPSREEKLIVNFHGLTLGTLTGGHFSPVAAYVPHKEMVLILDTAAHKNEPFWIPLKDLHHAMTKVDSGSGRTRGWIRVGKANQSKN